MTKRQLEQLLRHESFLRRVARRLVRDASRADDVVQETWLAVLRSNKAPSEVHTGWLAGIVRNLARRKIREESRRLRREKRAARPDAIEVPVSAGDSEFLRRRLAQQILALPERYREPLLLRYYEGLEPAAIAARLGLPPSTVRTQLQRGLAQVRRGLEANGNGASLSVMPTLAAIATAPRLRPLRHAAALGVGLAASLLAIVIATDPRNEAARADAPRETSRLAYARTVGAGVRDRPDVTRTSEPEPIETVAGAHVLTGRIRLPDNLLIGNATMEVSAPDRPGMVRVTAGARYQASLDPLFKNGAPRALEVRIDHPACEPVSRRLSPSVREADFVLHRVPAVAPEVLGPSRAERNEPARFATDASDIEAIALGRGPTGVRATPVFLHAILRLPAGVAAEPITLAVCGGAGCLRFRAPPNRAFRANVGALLRDTTLFELTISASSEHTLRTERRVAVYAGPVLERVDLELVSGRVVHGRVAFDDGSAAAGATVAVLRRSNGLPGGDPIGASTVEADGSFQIAIPEHDDAVLLATAAGWTPATAEAMDGAHLILRRGATIRGRIASAEGGIVGEGVELTPATAPPDASPRTTLASGTLRWTAGGPRWIRQTTQTGGAGEFTLAGIAPGSYHIRAVGETREVDAPGSVEFVPVRESLTLRVTARGAPLPGASVRANDVVRTTGADGRVALTRIGRAPVAVHVSAAGFRSAHASAGADALLEIELLPDDLLASLDVHLAPTAGVPFAASSRVVLTSLANAAVALDAAVPVRGGTLQLEGIDPGSYRLRVEPHGWHFPVQTTVTLASGAPQRLTLRPEAGGRFEVTLLDSNGRAAPVSILRGPASGRLWTESNHVAPTVVADSQHIDAWTLLPAGAHVVWVVPRDAGLRATLVPLIVRPGQTTRTTILAAKSWRPNPGRAGR
ncbi:MAG: sigma-70 family RNA polymerase sigma factor [Planctomycetota bacterium]|jgi:RNA polymerase sigma-70 factor (ECF subfamily)